METELTTYEWVKVTEEAAFPGRDGAGALVHDDRMWLIAGWNPADKQTNPVRSNCNNEVWSSVDGATWLLEKPNTHLNDDFVQVTDWEARHTAGYVVHDGRMWIVGGDSLLGHYQDDVWCSSDGIEWHWVNRHRPVPWGPRSLHYTFVFQQRIWVLGGQTTPQFAPQDEIFYADVWNSDDGLHWDRVEMMRPFTPHRGMIGGSAVFQDRIWLLGGGTYDTPGRPRRAFHNDVWSSTNGSEWVCHLEHAPWRPRQYHTVAVFDNCLWVLGGWVGQDVADVWYSPDGISWQEVPNTPWHERHAASVFVYRDALWMVAGSYMGRDVWKLTGRAQA